jgi:hypothetical protein
MADQECSVCQKLISAEVKIIFASMGSLADEPAMRHFQRYIVKQPGGLLKEEHRKSGRARSIQVPAFGLESLTIGQMNPAVFAAGKASIMVRPEGGEPLHQSSPVDVTIQRPISFQPREHVASRAPVCNRRFQFRVHGPMRLHAETAVTTVRAILVTCSKRPVNQAHRKYAWLERQRPIDEIDLFAIVAVGSNGAGIGARQATQR